MNKKNRGRVITIDEITHINHTALEEGPISKEFDSEAIDWPIYSLKGDKGLKIRSQGKTYFSEESLKSLAKFKHLTVLEIDELNGQNLNADGQSGNILVAFDEEYAKIKGNCKKGEVFRILDSGKTYRVAGTVTSSKTSRKPATPKKPATKKSASKSKK